MSLRLRESGISLSDTVSVMTETVDETALVAALRDGDKGVFAKLVDQHTP